MLTHFNQKSGQIWPKGSLGTLFRPNLEGYRAVGPHPAPCGQVLGGFDTLRGHFELYCAIWGTLWNLCEDYGACEPLPSEGVREGTQA